MDPTLGMSARGRNEQHLKTFSSMVGFNLIAIIFSWQVRCARVLYLPEGGDRIDLAIVADSRHAQQRRVTERAFLNFA